MKGIVWNILVIEKLETAIEEKKKEVDDLRKGNRDLQWTRKLQ